MTWLHVVLVIIGAGLALATLLLAHTPDTVRDVMPVATMIVGGALGHAGSGGRGPSRHEDKKNGG